jgi:hypothetical protein
VKPRFLTRILLTCLLILGAQVIQDSPLHSHAHDLQHVVDCTLCHAQSSDTIVDTVAAPTRFDTRQPLVESAASSFVPTPGFALYQGRAPPALSLI